jgi:TPR repeat protein
MPFELEGHAGGHGRVYQQGLGQQFNVERAYVGSEDTIVSKLLAMPMGTLVREADPLELGVHRSVISYGNAVPRYVPRDIDYELDEKVQFAASQGSLIIIVGDSTAGKSRSAYEAVLRVTPNRRLVVPEDRSELHAALMQVLASPGNIVLWLDNIERFLGPDGLTPRIVSYLNSMKVVSVGTMRAEEYRRFRELSIARPSTDSRQHSEMIIAEHVLDQADRLIMQRRWSASEAVRARQTDDPRIVMALEYGESYGIAEYLAAGPMLYDEWQLAWSAGANPRGAALVAAAVDCYRAGLPYYIPLDLLRDLHEYYLDSRGGALLRPEPLESAVAWAARRRYGVTSLLLPGKQEQTYRAFDYLVDKAMEAGSSLPVPSETWNFLVNWADGKTAQLQLIATAAYAQQRADIAEDIWRRLTSGGVGTAAYRLARMLLAGGRFAEAEELFVKAFELGYLKAATELGHFLEYERKELDKAEPWYARAAEEGDPHGMYHVGLIAANRGEDQKAEEWFRRAIDRKEAIASIGLGELLVKSKRIDEAESLLRHAMDAGDKDAGNYLAIVFADVGRKEEAERIWLKLAESNVAEAEANLARFYRINNRGSLAEKWYNKAVEHNMGGVRVAYGSFLAGKRRWVEAEAALMPSAEAGDLEACVMLGDVLYETNRAADSIPWYLKAVDEGNGRAVSKLALALERAGRSKDAIPYWQRLAAQNDADASYALGKISLSENDWETAMPFFASAADEGDALAACELARIYWRTEKDDTQAEKWLKASVELGHPHAACLLGSLYREMDKLDEAEKCWRQAYEMGHFDAALRLSRLLASRGRGREASLWLRLDREQRRRSNQVQKASTGKRGAKKKRRR